LFNQEPLALSIHNQSVVCWNWTCYRCLSNR